MKIQKAFLQVAGEDTRPRKQKFKKAFLQVAGEDTRPRKQHPGLLFALPGLVFLLPGLVFLLPGLVFLLPGMVFLLPGLVSPPTSKDAKAPDGRAPFFPGLVSSPTSKDAAKTPDGRAPFLFLTFAFLMAQYAKNSSSCSSMALRVPASLMSWVPFSSLSTTEMGSLLGCTCIFT